MLVLEKVGRKFQEGAKSLQVLHDISFEVGRKDFVAITGPSGSGKTTLLGLLAALDQPSEGKICLEGRDLGTFNEKELSELRGKKIGFVFQNFQLIPTMTALENVRIPAELRGDFQTARKAIELLERVQLAHRAHHYPHQLSGGEMQRVAIARATIHKPDLLLADEPTGNLDSKNGDLVVKLLQEMQRHATLILVTHNKELAKLAGREICLKDGNIQRVFHHKKKVSGKARLTKKKT